MVHFSTGIWYIIQSVQTSRPISLDKYELFNFIECDSKEKADSYFPMNYYLVKKNYYGILDNKLMSYFSDYEKLNSGNYRRVINDKFYLEFDFKNFREQVKYSLSDYSFPAIDINFNNVSYLKKANVRDFIFISGLSFILFYNWSNDFIYNRDGMVISVSRKTDEPIIIKKDSNHYLISNSSDKIIFWNEYISTLLNLQLVHFRIFEEWIIESVLEQQGFKG